MVQNAKDFPKLTEIASMAGSYFTREVAMRFSTPLTQRLGIRHPVLLAPMDLVSDARLTCAVSDAGGLGILGAGYGDEHWLRRELDVVAKRELPFGVGFITWSMVKQPKLLDMALECKPVAVMLSFGDPVQFVSRIKEAGALAICQVQSVALAKEAVAAGADILVAQGTEGGGHGASRGLSTLVPEVVDELGDRALVVAAGGVADGRGLAAALMLGATGVLVGTRFYASAEAAGADTAKERIRSASGDLAIRSIVFDISRRNVWPAPFTGRCLRNQHLDAWLGRELELLRNLETESVKYAKARSEGNFDISAVIAGESAGLVRDILPAREIIERMVDDAAHALRYGASNFEVTESDMSISAATNRVQVEGA